MSLILNVLINNQFLNFSSFFSFSLKMICLFFLFYVNMVNYDFQILTLLLIPRINLTWWCCIVIFIYNWIHFSSVQSLSHVQLFATRWTAACQASLSITSSWSLLKLMSVVLVMPSNHLSSPSPPAFSLSQHQGIFQWVSSHKVAKILELQL